MKAADRLLQRWRIRRALPFIPPGARVLDVGCGDGALFTAGEGLIGSGVGIDPAHPRTFASGPFEFRLGPFPDALADEAPESFDAMTMLAVLEHVPQGEHAAWGAACRSLLRRGGRLVITVPSPAVDPILGMMRRARLLDGMALEEHYGFKPHEILVTFTRGFRLLHRRSFQLGLNNLFVFERT